jgi:glycosyltransferase involved in cell wall biosynthesis
MFQLDVSGLVLSMGEKTTLRAIKSLENQTVPCKEIIRVDCISPFYKAINKGISRVNTEFFIQCDADMVLDPDCIEVMFKFVRDDVGVVIAFLSDELLGIVQAIKLFRTECLKKIRFPNSISPDTECINQLKEAGWKYVFAKRTKKRYGHTLGVLGTHDPEYTPMYTFEKFKLEGSRIRYRGVYQEFITCIEKLRKSSHPMAHYALLGFCRGFFIGRTKDGLTSHKPSRDFKILELFLSENNKKNLDFSITKE